MPKPFTVIKAQPEPSIEDRIGTVEQHDEHVFRNAHHFTVSHAIGIGAPETTEFTDFAAAALNAYHDRRALVYAVTEAGRSVCLVRSRWADFLVIWKQMHPEIDNDDA